MDSVQVVSPRQIELHELRPILTQYFSVEEAGYGRLVVVGLSSRVYISNNAKPELSDACSFLLEHSGGLELLKQVLEVIADNPEVTIDNEFGTVLPGDAFVALLRANPNWDWRVGGVGHGTP